MFKKLSHWENKKHVRTNDGDYVCWSAFYRWKSVVSKTDPMLRLLQPPLGAVNRVRYMNQNNSILLYSRGWLCSRATLSQHFSVQLWLMKDWIPDEWITLTGVYPRQVNSVCAPCEAESNRGLALSAPGLNLHANIQQPDRPCQSAFMGRGVQKPYWPWTNPIKVIESSSVKSEERLTKQPVFVKYLLQNPSPAKTTLLVLRRQYEANRLNWWVYEHQAADYTSEVTTRLQWPSVLWGCSSICISHIPTIAL